VRVRRRLPAEPGEIIQLPLSQGHIGQADCQHHVRFPEPARAHFPAERHATGWLPAGWMPMENNTHPRMALVSQAKAA
jgi:hypothetical protein